MFQTRGTSPGTALFSEAVADGTIDEHAWEASVRAYAELGFAANNRWQGREIVPLMTGHSGLLRVVIAAKIAKRENR